ncbi:hypothetical protein [Streptomyces sp. NPDC127084]|uniref:hypothetical protein n=1 Tax=Streptomyces sp. NPDC127084 TaxID=3347133 RepID=UPI00365ED371
MKFLMSSTDDVIKAEVSDRALCRVITLLYINLAISVVLTICTLVLWNQTIDYQMAHFASDAPISPSSRRHFLAMTNCITPAVTLALSLLYLRVASKLRNGARRTYVRTLVIAIASLVTLAYPTFSSQYPVWVRLGHGAQMVLALALLRLATRPAVRARFRVPGS